MIRFHLKILFSTGLVGCCFLAQTRAFTPHPDHVVVLILENTSYSEVVNASAAPYINSLIADPKCALFTQSYGLSRPSQPNYLQLFSGSAQGVTTNDLPAGLPFTTPNLGAQLLGAAHTFAGYSEDLPFAGFTGEFAGAYARKHNPWVNWQGSSMYAIPDSLNLPFTAFPADYNQLPDLCFVVPNQDNDMHNGSYPARVTAGDTWVQNKLDAYIQWAKTHNSLFILTFDEDNYFDQHIVTLFIGPMVNPGSYSNSINHYNVLRLMEDMFYLPYAGAAAAATPIDYCWVPCYALSNITASGPTGLCTGDSVTLTAGGGNSILWSTGATTQSIVVHTAGNYSVTVTDGMGCTATSSPVVVTVGSFNAEGNVFTESMGSVTATTAIAVHEAANGFDNDNLLMTGSGDVRITTPSSGYAQASGGANVFLTNVSGRNFMLADIHTSSLPDLQLSFGVYKNTSTATGADLQVQVSPDGTTWSNLSFPALPTGTGTAAWHYRTASGTIPATANLRIQFRQNGTVTQYRIDDVKLSFTLSSPQITASGPLTFCEGGSVTLQASAGSGYLWSNGATTQNIHVVAGGDYFVKETGLYGCTLNSDTLRVHVNKAPVISGIIPASAPVGSNVTVKGTFLSGVTAVAFNGIQASFVPGNDSTLTATVPAGAADGPVTADNGCGVGSGPFPFVVGPTTPALVLKLFIEGYYSGGGLMAAPLGNRISDTMVVDLRNVASPHSIIHTVKGVINDKGDGIFHLPMTSSGMNYYLAVSSRNALETWSASPVLIETYTTYDFSTSPAQAYGNHVRDLGDGNFALFSGDMNADGVIDVADWNAIKSSALLFQTGYVKHDLTGDRLVESADFSVVENNLNNITMHP